MRKNHIYRELVPELKRIMENEGLSQRKACKVLHNKYPKVLTMAYGTFRSKMNKAAIDFDKDIGNNSSTETSEEGYDSDDKDSDAFKVYCKQEGLDINKVKSAKYVNHNGQGKFNVVLKFDEEVEDIDWNPIKEKIKSELDLFKIDFKKGKSKKGEGVVFISDLHLGAYIDGLIRSPEFNITTLTKMLNSSIEIINSHKYKKVHVHILGDLIESFSGLNHKNSWKGLDKGMHGANAVKLVTEILSNWLSLIINLGSVKVIAGNHDRTSSNNDEDVKGEAADLVSWGLRLKGFDVEFNPLVLTHLVEGINHILTHGHYGLSKMGTKEICWEYGKQGCFNLISEGHLHSRFKYFEGKKSKVIRDDAIDHRRIIHPSFFTGNFYSESNRWTTNAGFTIVEDNGRGKPHTFDYSI